MIHLTAILFAALYATTAQAQMICPSRDALVRQLEGRYGESPIGGGVANESITELWISLDGATWTIVTTFPNGVACIAAAGKNWQVLAQGEPA